MTDHLIISTYSSNVTGTDTQFRYTFNSQVMVKEMILNSFITTNLYANQTSGNDFSFVVGTTAYSFSISHIYLTLSTFFEYFNEIQSGTLSLSYSSPTYAPYYITITGDSAWYPTGAGWQQLGFSTTQIASHIASLTWDPPYPYDFTQSDCIMIQFGAPITNNSQQGDGIASWVIPNISSFGSQLSYISTNYTSPQRLILDTPIQVTNLQISILDQQKQLMHTVSQLADDNTGSPIIMDITIIQE